MPQISPQGTGCWEGPERQALELWLSLSTSSSGRLSCWWRLSSLLSYTNPFTNRNHTHLLTRHTATIHAIPTPASEMVQLFSTCAECLLPQGASMAGPQEKLQAMALKGLWWGTVTQRGKAHTPQIQILGSGADCVASGELLNLSFASVSSLPDPFFLKSQSIMFTIKYMLIYNCLSLEFCSLWSFILPFSHKGIVYFIYIGGFWLFF